MLIRRIEFLEEQSDKRSKTLYMENQEPLQREIEMLRSKLAHEREMKDQIAFCEKHPDATATEVYRRRMGEGSFGTEDTKELTAAE